MELVHALLFGSALLIALYLGVKNAGGVAQIFNSGSAAYVSGVKTLQGR
jgi:hypothetical protein